MAVVAALPAARASAAVAMTTGLDFLDGRRLMSVLGERRILDDRRKYGADMNR
jgi:hypothetical protein